MLKTYYTTDFAAKVRHPPWDLTSNIPGMSNANSSVQNKTNNSSNRDNSTGEEGIILGYVDAVLDTGDPATWAPAFFQLVLEGISSSAPWLDRAAADFFTLKRDPSNADQVNAGNILHDTLVCKFDNVMFCGQQSATTGMRVRRNILVCAIVSIVLWLLVAAIVGTIPVVGTPTKAMVYGALVVLVPVTTVHIAYGMAFTCAPMLPTCLLQDLILAAQVCTPLPCNTCLSAFIATG